MKAASDPVLTEIEEAALQLALLLRWGCVPDGTPRERYPEWPYRLVADGEADAGKLARYLSRLEAALKQRGLMK